MAFLTVLLVIGSIARIIVLVLRPSAAQRFHTLRRQILATRLEQTGDAVVLVIALSMVLFGYGHHPAGALVFFWTIALLGGFVAVLAAHAIARNHRLAARPYRS